MKKLSKINSLRADRENVRIRQRILKENAEQLAAITAKFRKHGPDIQAGNHDNGYELPRIPDPIDPPGHWGLKDRKAPEPGLF